MEIRQTVPLTLKRLKQVLDYDADTGIFRWRVVRKGPGSLVPGDIAGCKNSHGYLTMMIDGVRYKAQHLAWFYITGFWPSDWIDHENLIRDDNRITNLRPSNGASNAANNAGWARRKGPYKGVYPQKKSSKKPWYAAITRDRKLQYLGSFETPEAAHQAYLEAARAASGVFARGS